MSCNGICHRYKANGLPKEGRYKNGQKRCLICDIYIIWEGLWCPCCGNRIRSNPRGSAAKKRLRGKND